MESRRIDDFPSFDAPVPDAVDLVVEAEAMMSVFAAQRFVRIHALRREALRDAESHGHALRGPIERAVRLELACALGITEASADALIAQADALVNRYPAVLDSLGGARMTQRHATDLIEAVDEVEPDLRDGVVSAAIELAEALPVGSFRRRLRTLIESVRAATLAERHEEALASRRVVFERDRDGMAWIHLYTAAVEAHAIHGRVTAIAKVLAEAPDEERTLDQLRADVVGDLLIDGSTSSHPDAARGIRATVAVTVPVLTLLGVDEHGAAAPQGDPATVEGVGPIPIARARELCAGAGGWMRVLTHPETGMVLSVGRSLYRPPPELRRLVRWRAERCMAPGCGVPASRCEIDHNVAWEHGGETSLANLTPFCKGHHVVKHHGRWRVEQIPDSGGAILWVSPAGRSYRVEPERRVPVFTPFADDGRSTAPF